MPLILAVSNLFKLWTILGLKLTPDTLSDLQLTVRHFKTFYVQVIFREWGRLPQRVFPFMGREMCWFGRVAMISTTDQTRWLHRILFPQFWRLEVREQAVGSVGVFRGPLSLARRWPSSPYVCMCACVLISSSYKNKSYWIRVHCYDITLPKLPL